jgi:hypothetical protein
MCRLIEAEPHGETDFVRGCYAELLLRDAIQRLEAAGPSHVLIEGPDENTFYVVPVREDSDYGYMVSIVTHHGSVWSGSM